jgi:hypothetical protein
MAGRWSTESAGPRELKGLNRCRNDADYVMKRPYEPGLVVSGELR